MAIVDRTVREFDGLHILINNAGILERDMIEDTTLNDSMRVITVNQVGTFLGIRAAIPALRDSGGGSIVNTFSKWP